MKMARSLRLVLLFGSLCGVPAGSSAQSQSSLAPEQMPAAGWIFTPSIRFGVGWDDNILLADTGTDEPPGDYATPLNPSADLEYRGRRTRLSGGYDGAFLLYRTFEELNSTEQHARFTVEQRLSERVKLFANESFAKVPTTDALLLAGVPFYRVGSMSNDAGGGIEARVTRTVTIRGDYSLNYVTFADDSPAGVNLQGGHAHQVVVGVDRAISSRLSVGAEYELERAVTGGLDHFDSNTASAGIQYQMTPAFSVSGMVGVSMLGAGIGHDEEIGPAIRAAITRRTPRLVLSAVYSRSFIPSFGFGGTFQNEEWQGTVYIPFYGTRGYVDGNIARYDNDPLITAQPSLRSVWVSGTFGYRLTRWLSAEAYYGHAQQNSQRPGGDLGRHQYGFRMRAAKPMRLAK
jgi:hypothetical protein